MAKSKHVIIKYHRFVKVTVKATNPALFEMNFKEFDPYQTIPACSAEETVRALSISLVKTPAARP